MPRYNCAVLLATHNGEKYLTEQLLSIQSQVGVDCTVFYSDDNSTDSTIDILKTFGATPISTQNLHFGRSSKNFLWSIANFSNSMNFDYVFLADQDDIWLPTKCVSAIHKLCSENMDCYSGSYYRWVPFKQKIKYVNKFYVQNTVDYLFRSPGPGFTYCFSKAGYRKLSNHISSCWQQRKNHMWHDWYLYALARQLNLSWFIDKKAHSLYRQHESNETGQALLLSDYVDRLKFLISGKYRSEILKLPGLTQHQKMSVALQRFKVIDRIYLISKINLMRSRPQDRLALLLWLIFERAPSDKNIHG